MGDRPLAPPEKYSTTSAENMTYLVEFAARASRDLEILYKEKNAAESQAAARWYNGLEEALYALALFPLRCPVAPEARKAKRKLRHLLCGKKPTSIELSKSMNGGKRFGCSTSDMAQGGRLNLPTSNRSG